MQNTHLINNIETPREWSIQPVCLENDMVLYEGVYVMTADQTTYIVVAFEITPDGSDPYVIGRRLIPQGQNVAQFNEIDNEEVSFPASSVTKAVATRNLLVLS